uniref:Uncharacterized protein n=1 Tax=viral metagenome TaxID=1070528 RepID=A0A6C0J4C5_9ZZZZ
MIIEQYIKDHVCSELTLFHELLFKKIMEVGVGDGDGGKGRDRDGGKDDISSVKDYCFSVLKKSLNSEVDDEIKNNYIEVKLYNINGKEYMIDMEHGMVFGGKRVDIVDILKKQLLEKLKLCGSSVLNEEKDLFK